MPTLEDMLNVHNNGIAGEQAGADTQFTREFLFRFLELGTVFAAEQGRSCFEELLDDPGDPVMGPGSEELFAHLREWLRTEAVREVRRTFALVRH
ncbi:MAG: hypothetical protein Q8P21_02505 [bacterium]|nr:hypothetical protein [bacterium]